MIYFLKRSDGLVKIGTTGNFYSRLASLKKEHGDLEVIGWHNGDRQQEKEVHQRFAAYRVIHEWFYPSSELLRYLSESITQGEPPKPESDISIEQLRQMVTEKDESIQKQTARFDKLYQESEERRAGALRLGEIAKQLVQIVNQKEARIKELETQLASAQRQLYSQVKKAS